MSGVDSRRVSGQLDWRRTLTLQGGLRASPFLLARGDIYRLEDLAAPASRSAVIYRSHGSLGLDLAYPMIRRDRAGVTVLEPMAQLVISPRPDLDARIPNEDSQVLEFDETNLMTPDKFSGRDVYVGGPRANLGLRLTTSFDDGRGYSILIGRSLHERPEPIYPVRSGLSQRASDWVMAGEATIRPGVSLFARARLNPNGGSLRRIEAGVDARAERLSGYVRYLRDENDFTGGQREDLDINGEFQINERWGVTGYAIRDLSGSGWRRRDLGFFYQDDCLRLDIVYRRQDEFTNTAVGLPTARPSQSIALRLTLATLGDTR